MIAAMGWWFFYRRWLWRALRHSVGVADLLASLVGSGVAVWAHYAPEAATATLALSWQVPLWAALGVVSLRLVLAPYWIWRDEQEKLRPAADRKAVRVALSEFKVQASAMSVAIGSTGAPDLGQIEDWKARVTKFLEESLDQSYVVRLFSSDGLNIGVAGDGRLPANAARNWLMHRGIRLDEFIREFAND